MTTKTLASASESHVNFFCVRGLMSNPNGILQLVLVPRLKLTDERIANFVAFGEAVRRIHARLLAEGYRIENGVITTKPRSYLKTKQSHYKLKK